ncbi:MAG: hypothetical protein ACI4EA_10635, partial [Candidatus Ornithomonoglobus sp.]
MNKTKRLLSLFTSVAMAASTFSAIVIPASAENSTVTYELSQSASGQNDTQNLVLNLTDSETKAPVTFNSNTGTWKGVAVLEFDIPATNPELIVGSTLNVSLHNMGNRGGNRTYQICKSNGVTLGEETTCADVLAANGDVLYTGAALADGGYRNEEITEKDITDYIKSVVSADEATTVQLAFTNAAQMFEIYTALDDTVTAITAAAPTLTLEVADASTVFHKVTVKVTSEDEELSSEDFNVADGEAFTPTFEESFSKDGYKYTYVSGGDTLDSVTDDTTITLVYSKRELVKTTVTLNGGEILGDIASSEITEDSTVTINYPKYILKEGVLYNVPAEAFVAKTYYGVAVTGTDSAQVVNVPYKEVADASAIYYAELEDIAEDSSVSNAAIRCSNGAAYKVPAEGISIGTLSAGTYTVEAAVWGAADDTYTIKAGETEALSFKTTGSLVTETSEPFTLSEPAEVTITGTAEKNSGLDYILIMGDGSFTEADEPTETETDAPSEDVSTDAPSEDVSTDAPSEDVSTDTPSEDVSTDTPSEDVSTDTPSEDVSTDAPSEDVSTDAPSAAEIAWTFGEDTSSTIDAGTLDLGNGLSYISDGKSAYAIGKTIDGIEFPNRIKLGGKSTFDESSLSRVFTFTPSAAGTITVYFITGSNKNDGRHCVAMQNGETIINELAVETENEDGSFTGVATTATARVAADIPVYIGGDNNIGIYGITFTPDAPSTETDAPSTETDAPSTETDIPSTETDIPSVETTAPTPEVVETKDMVCSFTVDDEEVTINVTVGYDKDGNIVDVTTDSEEYTVKPAVDNYIGVYAGETLIATVEPTEKPVATDEPTNAPAADGVYINESFESYDVAEIIRSTGNDVSAAPDPVTLGSIIYMAGHRGNGSLSNIASVKQNGINKYFNVSADSYATNSRGISFQFAAEAGIPAVSDIPDGKVLVLDMDIESDQSFTLTGFGTIPAVTGTAAAVLSVADDAASAKAVLVPTESADSAVVVKAVYENGRLVSAVTEAISNVVAGTPIEVEAAAGTKVMLWNSLEGMKPIAPTAVSAAVTPATTAPTEDVPTAAPTEDVPTAAPTEDVPTTAPTEDVPTTAPTEDVPTTAPTEDVPTAAPTDAPTKDPDATEAPVPASGLPHLKAVIDPDNNKQYVIITAADGTLVSSTVADLTATGFTGAEFFTGAGNFDIDNIKVSVKDADAGILTVKVTDGDAALAGATVTVGTLSGVTNTNGEAVFALPNGDYTVTASKSGYEHTKGLQDDAITTVTVNSDSQTAELTLSVMSYDKLPETVTIKDGQGFVAASKTAEPNTTAAFTVEVLDQYGIMVEPEEYTLTWAIYPAGTTTADPNVTIDKNGVVSVAQAFNAANNVAEYDVTATAVMNNEGLRGQTVTKTLVVGNNDITYYEPINWVQPGGTTNRNGSTTFAESIALSGMISVTLNIAFPTGTEDETTLAIMSGNTKFAGLQLTADNTVTAWTGWTGSSNMNQHTDTVIDAGAYSNGKAIITDYDKSAVDVTFVIDAENKQITVSSGTETVSLSYTGDITSLTGFSFGQYRSYGAVTVNSITVREPDNNYLSISGANGVAKVSGTTVTRTYALGQSVIIPDETFTWSVSGDNTAVTIADGVLSIADTAVAGTYTITATSTTNTEKTASFDVEVGDFQTITAANAEVSGPQAYNLGTDTTGTYSVTKAIDSY